MSSGSPPAGVGKVRGMPKGLQSGYYQGLYGGYRTFPYQVISAQPSMGPLTRRTGGLIDADLSNQTPMNQGALPEGLAKIETVLSGLTETHLWQLSGNSKEGAEMERAMDIEAIGEGSLSIAPKQDRGEHEGHD